MTEASVQPLTDPATVFAWCAARFAGTPAQALFALDRQLGEIVRSTTQPLVGQMRLTWWHEALTKLSDAPVPAHPVLRSLAALHLPPTMLARMVDGWEMLLAEELDGHALHTFAHERGASLFALLSGNADAADARTCAAGEGWALADLAAHVTDPAIRAEAQALAAARLGRALAGRWRRGGALAGVARDAQLAVAGLGTPGSPRRAGAVLRMRLLGR